MQNKVAFSKDWKWVAIKDLSVPTPNAVVDGPFGSNLKTSDYVEKGIPVLQGPNITGNKFSLKELRFVKKQKAQELKRSLVRVGDLLVVKIGSIGYAAIIDNLGNFESALIPANLLKASFDKNKINSQYILHYLTSDFGFQNLNDLAGRTAQPAISLKKFKELQIPVPPIPEQTRIAEILDTIDEAIQKTEALISKLKAMKQGLMHDLLTRGLDETGKLRDPIAHPEQFKDSLVGRIPKKWEIKPLEEIAEVDRGKFTHRPRNDPLFYGGTHPFVQTGDIANAGGRILDSYSQTLNDRGTSVSRKFPKETIAITIAANIADTAILGYPMYFPDSVVGAIVRPPNNVRYIELCIRNAKKTLEARAPQSAQKNINLEDLRPLLIAKPKPREQHRIGDLYNTYEARISTEEKYRDKLKLQKKGLMHDLLTGKVRVKV